MQAYGPDSSSPSKLGDAVRRQASCGTARLGSCVQRALPGTILAPRRLVCGYSFQGARNHVALLLAGELRLNRPKTCEPLSTGSGGLLVQDDVERMKSEVLLARGCDRIHVRVLLALCLEHQLADQHSAAASASWAAKHYDALPQCCIVHCTACTVAPCQTRSGHQACASAAMQYTWQPGRCVAGCMHGASTVHLIPADWSSCSQACKANSSMSHGCNSALCLNQSCGIRHTFSSCMHTSSPSWSCHSANVTMPQSLPGAAPAAG